MSGVRGWLPRGFLYSLHDPVPSWPWHQLDTLNISSVFTDLVITLVGLIKFMIDDMEGHSMRITETAYKVQPARLGHPFNITDIVQAVTCTLCSVAIIGAAARTMLRVQQNQQRAIDDLLFFFACICLIAATILLVKEAASIYIVANVITSFFGGSSLENQVASSPQILEHAFAVVKSEGYAYSVLIWVAIFMVKFCYLCFFRLLVDRLKGLVVYWRVTMSITAISSLFNICALFIACPYFGQKACEIPFHSPKSHPLSNQTVRYSINVWYPWQLNAFHHLTRRGS